MMLEPYVPGGGMTPANDVAIPGKYTFLPYSVDHAAVRIEANTSPHTNTTATAFRNRLANEMLLRPHILRAPVCGKNVKSKTNSESYYFSANCSLRPNRRL